MESERDSRRLKSRLSDMHEGEYHRLNVLLKDVPNGIDTVEAMEDYKNLVILQPGSARMARESAMMLLASRFYFVLDDLPENTSTPFWCRGNIRCKGSATKVILALKRLQPEGLTLVSDQGKIEDFVGLLGVCQSCGAYSQSVTFLTRHIDHVVSISLQSPLKQKWRIGGFPASVSSLATRQGMWAPFGRNDHGYPFKSFCKNCDRSGATGGRRRQRDSACSSDNLRSKKMRTDTS